MAWIELWPYELILKNHKPHKELSQLLPNELKMILILPQLWEQQLFFFFATENMFILYQYFKPCQIFQNKDSNLIQKIFYAEPSGPKIKNRIAEIQP